MHVCMNMLLDCITTSCTAFLQEDNHRPTNSAQTKAPKAAPQAETDDRKAWRELKQGASQGARSAPPGALHHMLDSRSARQRPGARTSAMYASSGPKSHPSTRPARSASFWCFFFSSSNGCTRGGSTRTHTHRRHMAAAPPPPASNKHAARGKAAACTWLCECL